MDLLHGQIVEKWGLMSHAQRSVWVAEAVGGWTETFSHNHSYYGTPPEGKLPHTIPQYAETGSGMLSVMHLMTQKGFAVNLQMVDIERPKAMTVLDTMVMERKVYTHCEMMIGDYRGDQPSCGAIGASSVFAPDAVALCAVLATLTIPEQGKDER